MHTTLAIHYALTITCSHAGGPELVIAVGGLVKDMTADVLVFILDGGDTLFAQLPSQNLMGAYDTVYILGTVAQIDT
ncbi:MAG: hypothetical protein A4E19_12460 [Nitrospira sp. SG-bin1]|nr:MAG: hypothetical protein A4E19_12460 [Nitrospira sp. SG-bin1]